MKMKNSARREPICKVALAGLSICAAQVTSAADVTIATFNSPAMLELKKLSASFENANRDCSGLISSDRSIGGQSLNRRGKRAR